MANASTYRALVAEFSGVLAVLIAHAFVAHACTMARTNFVVWSIHAIRGAVFAETIITDPAFVAFAGTTHAVSMVGAEDAAALRASEIITLAILTPEILMNNTP